MKNYTAEQIQQNYDKFIDALKKVFKGERLEKLLHMYSDSELGQELAVAPASGKLNFHNAYVGGYIDHIMNVARNAHKMKKLFVILILNYVIELLKLKNGLRSTVYQIIYY